jgi:signal transduction histidine kinase/CheY-like chemotaxis protein
MRVLILFCLVLFSSFSFAQTPVADSLRQCIATAGTPAGRFEQIYKLGAHFSVKSYPDSVLACANLIQQEAARANRCIDNAHAADLYGRYYYICGAYEKAISHYTEGKEYYRQCGKPAEVVYISRSMAACYFELKMFGEALELTLEILPYFESKKDSACMSAAYSNIGKYMTDIGRLSEARHYLFRALAINRKTNKSSFFVLGEIGDYYAKLGMQDSSLFYYETAIVDGEKKQDLYIVNSGKIGFCDACINAGLMTKARTMCNSAFLYYKDKPHLPEWSEINAVMSKLEVKAGRPAKGLQFAKTAIETARVFRNKTLLEQAYKAASDAYVALGDYREAYRHTLFWKEVADSIQHLNQHEKTAELEARFHTQEQQTTIAAQQLRLERAQNSSRTVQWISGVALLFVAGGFSFLRSKIRARQREAEHALALEHTRAEQLAENERLRSNFLTNISHEFRTPLMLILSPLQTLRNAEVPGAEIAKYYNIMERNAHRLLQLIHQLLDLAKLENQEMALRPAPGNLSQTLRFIAGNFESVAVQNNIRYQVKLPKTEIYAEFDHDKVEKIVTNLLGNAFKFTPEGGTIDLVADVEKYPESGAEMLVKISVSDNGIGMDAAQQANAFRRFYMVEHQSNTEQTGTGIGLSLVKELVELHGGEVELESQPGKGSTFTVFLPLKKAEIEKNEALPIPPPASGLENTIREKNFMPVENEPRTTILVIDDNPDIRNFLAAQLQPQFQVLLAADGQEGLETALESMPHIILSDVMMPQLDGMEFLTILRNDRRTSHIPVVMLTAKARKEDRFEGLLSGADAYLVKPFDIDELLITVNNLLQRQQVLREKFSQSFKILPSNSLVVSADAYFLMQVKTAIEKNMGNESFGVEALAEAVSMSRVHLYRKLHALTGQTPTTVIREMRLTRAKYLIESGAGNASEVAYMVGFSSPAYFSTVFANFFGTPPSEIKKCDVLL